MKDLEKPVVSYMVALVVALLVVWQANVRLDAKTKEIAASDKTAPQAIRIAFLTSLSGASSKDGPQMVNGFNLFLDQVGHKFAGHPVELQVENDECNPATAVAKLKKVIEQDKKTIRAGRLSWIPTGK